MLTLSLAALVISPAPQFSSWELAFVRDGNIWTSRGDGSKAKLLIRNGDYPAWSPDGTRIAFVQSGKAMIYNVREKRARVVWRFQKPTGYEPQIYWLEWDPARPFLLVCQDHGRAVGVVGLDPKVPGGDDTILKSRWDMRVGAPSFRRDGKFLGFCWNGDVWLADCDPKQWLANAEPGSMGDMLDYYNDARRLAPLAIFNEGEIGVSARTPDWIDGLAWTGDGRRIAVHSQRQGGSGFSNIGYLDLLPPGKDTWVWFDYKVHWLPMEMVFCPRICPDGKTLSYHDNAGIKTCDWQGKHQRALVQDAMSFDWKPLSKSG